MQFKTIKKYIDLIYYLRLGRNVNVLVRKDKNFLLRLTLIVPLCTVCPPYNIDNDLYIIGGYEANETAFLQKVIKISLQKLADDELTFTVFNPEVAPSPRANVSCCLVGN